MHQEQRGRPPGLECCYHAFYGGEGRIDCGNDSPDVAAVFYLEPVDRIGFVGDVSDSKKLIEVAGNPGELLRFGHVPIRVNASGARCRREASILAAGVPRASSRRYRISRCGHLGAERNWNDTVQPRVGHVLHHPTLEAERLQVGLEIALLDLVCDQQERSGEMDDSTSDDMAGSEPGLSRVFAPKTLHSGVIFDRLKQPQRGGISIVG